MNKDKIAYYQRIFGAGQGNLESSESTPSLDTKKIEEITSSSAAELHRMREESGVKASTLSAVNDNILREGKAALKALSENDNAYFEDKPNVFDLLEVIVRTDGSRPSFLIKGGIPETDTTPESYLKSHVIASRNDLKKPIRCVGRIDKYGSHIGTGFLVGPDLLMTNRHVLQSIASQQSDGKWLLQQEITVDFGHELNGMQTFDTRDLKEVLFAGSAPIVPRSIDHVKFDMALVKLESGSYTDFLTIDATRIWETQGNTIFTIGYPGNPGSALATHYGNIITDLFQSQYGFKRLSPGEIIPSAFSPDFAHDATTLGGNSGSLIIVAGYGGIAAGLHYGGYLNAPRENWGHILNNRLAARDGFNPITFEECIIANGGIINK